MKNVIAILIVFIILSIGSVDADTININAYDSGNGQITIGYTMASGTSTPLAFGLDITLSNGAVIAGPGDVVSVNPAFPVFLDYAYNALYSDPEYSYAYGDGHPLAETNMPLPIFSASSSFALNLAAVPGIGVTGDLNMDGDTNIEDVNIFACDWLILNDSSPFSPADFNLDGKVDLVDYAIMTNGPTTPTSMVDLITLQLRDGGLGFTDVTIGLNFRGGIVGTDGLETNLPESVRVIVPEPLTLSLLGLGGIAVLRRRSTWVN